MLPTARDVEAYLRDPPTEAEIALGELEVSFDLAEDGDEDTGDDMQYER